MRDGRGVYSLKQLHLALVAVCFGLWQLPSVAMATEVVERDDLVSIFREQGLTGTFVLFDPAKDVMTVVNPARAEKRFVPASTFKIANSLIALETGVVRDENEVIPYGGKPQPFKTWEKDMPMREAITLSNVAIYQEIARRVGVERYRDWLRRLGYGNAATGESVTTFWLDGPLEISAAEQTRFLAALVSGRTAASKRSTAIVRDILRLEAKSGATLYGKTGWRFSSTPQLGWWVGWVERDSGTVTFALNVDLANAEDGKKRVPLGKALLQKLGQW